MNDAGQDLVERVADTLFEEAWKGHTPCPPTYRDDIERRQFHRYARAAIEAIDQSEVVEALRSIANSTCCEGCNEAKLVARAALAKHGEKP